MFEEFLAKHHEELTQKEAELSQMLPNIVDDDFDKFMKLIMQSQDEAFEKEFPVAQTLFYTVTTAFQD